MKRSLYGALALCAVGASPLFASERCNVPMADWQPREALQKKLEEDGWKVSRIKTDDGCYEVRATDDKGRQVEASFDPKTLQTAERDGDD